MMIPTVLLIAALLANTAAAQQPPVDPVMEQIREAQALMEAGNYDAAIERLRRAQTLGGRPAMVALNLAKAHAHRNEADAAFAQLRRAADVGLGALPPPFDRDADLAALKTDPRYKAFERALDRNARPCEHDPVYRQFDYWIGRMGRAAVRRATDHGAGHQRHHQHSPGVRHPRILGRARPEGTRRVRTRLSFFRQPDGSVRQYSERTEDGGKTWIVNYDLHYTRKK